MTNTIYHIYNALNGELLYTFTEYGYWGIMNHIINLEIGNTENLSAYLGQDILIRKYKAANKYYQIIDKYTGDILYNSDDKRLNSYHYQKNKAFKKKCIGHLDIVRTNVSCEPDHNMLFDKIVKGISVNDFFELIPWYLRYDMYYIDLLIIHSNHNLELLYEYIDPSSTQLYNITFLYNIYKYNNNKIHDFPPLTKLMGEPYCIKPIKSLLCKISKLLNDTRLDKDYSNFLFCLKKKIDNYYIKYNLLLNRTNEFIDKYHSGSDLEWEKYLSDEEKDDADLMFILCIYNCDICVPILSPNLRDNSEFLSKLVKEKLYEDVFLHCSERLHHDKLFIKIIIDEEPNSLLNAPKFLLADKSLVLYAIQQGGHQKIFRLLSDDDEESIIQAIKYNNRLYEFAPAYIRNNKDLLIIVLNTSADLLKFANESFQIDKSIVKIAVEIDGKVLKYAHASLQKDPEIVTSAVSQNGYALHYADESLQDNFAIVKIAVENNWRALSAASISLQHNDDIIRIAKCTQLNKK